MTTLQVDALVENIAVKLEQAIGREIGTAMRVSLYQGERIAREKAPVRKLFRGGRQTSIAGVANPTEETRTRTNAGIPDLLPVGTVTRHNRANTYRNTGDLRVASVQTLASGEEGLQHARGIPGIFDAQGRSRRNPALHPKAQLVLGDYAMSRLSGRGRYELRTGRALTRSGELGGFLRSSMGVNETYVAGNGLFYGEIYNTAPYARYVEFGTSHARAQPFLRPTMAFLERFYPAQMRRQLARIGRAGI